MIRFLSHLYELSEELEEQRDKEKELEETLETLSDGFGVQQRMLRAMLLRKKVQDRVIRMLRCRFIQKQASILKPFGFTELDELEKEEIEIQPDTNESIPVNETPQLSQQNESNNSPCSSRSLLEQLPSLESIRSSLHESEATAAIKFAEYQSACQSLQEFHVTIDSVADEISLLKRQLFTSKQAKPEESLEVAKGNRIERRSSPIRSSNPSNWRRTIWKRCASSRKPKKKRLKRSSPSSLRGEFLRW